MRPAFWLSVGAFALLSAALMAARVRLEDQRASVEQLYLALDDHD